MNKLTCIENYIDTNNNHFGSFLIEPLELGQGITLGNSLRRTLLSDLTGLAITGVRINNLKHEFSIIEGLREDILEVLLNLKEIKFKNSFSFKENLSLASSSGFKLKGFLKIKGPIVITAGMFNLPKNIIKIINPNQYICTIVDNSEIYLEIDIEKGKGYRLGEEYIKYPKKRSTLFIDALFMPIKKVNYKIKLIHDTEGNIKESLNLEILTNGTISPERSLQESLKILINLFYPLFVNPNFLMASSELSNNINKEQKFL